MLLIIFTIQTKIDFRKATGTNGVALGNTIILSTIGYHDIGMLLNVMIFLNICLILGYTIIIVGQQFQLLKDNKLIMSGLLLNGLYQTKLLEFIFFFNNSSYTAVQKKI